MTIARRPSRSRSTTQEAVAGIKRYIREQGLRRGDMLPSETVLCAVIGCSRSAIREAIRSLVTLDIVEVRHGYGTFVSDMSLEPLINGMVFRTILNTDTSLKNLLHVVETREILDLALGTELLRTFDGQLRNDLLGYVDRMREHSEKGESFAAEDRSFHLTLASKVGNPLIRELNDAFWRIQAESQPLLSLPMPADIHQTIDAHQEIVEALNAADPDRYEAAVKNHYAPFRRLLAQKLGME